MSLFFEEECIFQDVPYRLQVYGNMSDPTFVISPLSERPLRSKTNDLCKELVENLPLNPHQENGKPYPDANARVSQIKWLEQKPDGHFEDVSFRVYGKDTHGPGVYWGEYKRVTQSREQVAERLDEKVLSRLDRPAQISETDLAKIDLSKVVGPSIDRSSEHKR